MNVDRPGELLQMRYCFSAYGLTLSAPFAFPELPECNVAATDVNITWGTIPTTLANPTLTTAYFTLTPDEAIIHAQDVAHFHVIKGKQIVIEPVHPLNEPQIRFYLLGFVMGILLKQRQALTLHASAVATEKGCLLFLAPSGCGKSTLAAAFSRLGYRLLTDDICVVDEQSVPHAIPGFPQIKIKSDAAAHFAVQTEKLRPLLKEKFAWLLRDDFEYHPKPILAMIELGISATNQFEWRPLRGGEKIQLLKQHTFKEELSAALQLQQHHFIRYRPLTAIPMAQLKRPATGTSIDQQVTFLLTKLPSLV